MFAALLRGSFEEFMLGFAGTQPADVVQAPGTIEHYLHIERGLAKWHVDLLVRHLCVSVVRGSTRHNSVQWDFALRTDDRVLLDESGAAYQAAYRAVPAKTYAMVARHDASDAHLHNVSNILDERGAIVLSDFHAAETIVSNLSEFLAHIRTDHRVTGPVRDLVIGSHASWGGRLYFETDVMQDSPVTTYETVDAVASSLAIPDDSFLPRPNPDPGRRIVFLGCDAGDSKPLLARLRQAINPQTPVLAPKHWWGTGYVGSDMFEFVGVAHMVYSPQELSRADLISKLQALGARDANDDLVPANQWDEWVPPMQNVPVNIGWRENLFVSVKLPEIRFPGHIIPQVNAHDVQGHLFHWRGKFPPCSLSTNLSQAAFDAAPFQALKDAITSLAPDPRNPFTRAHPYPWWERFRVLPPPNPTAAQMKATIERWIDLFVLWPQRVVDADGDVVITADGVTDVYVLVVPGTDRNGFLFVNYYSTLPNAPVPAREDLGYASRFWAAG
jgi:hypothetical protein